MADRLLSIKLTPPRPSRPPISRPRVVELLADGSAARLILVSAPPGFGKTTALLEWLAVAGARSAWLSLDEADNDPARFLRYLWAAAAVLAGEEPDSVRDGGGGGGGDVLGAVDELALLLAARPEPGFLVLDDYHVISAPAVQRAVGVLVERVPCQVHLVISSRADPALPLSRLRARGELLEVRADTLRFTTDEAAAFFADRAGLALAAADLDALVARTEGWPAVLQLAGLSLAGRTDVTERIRDFAATHRFVLDYITDEVLGRLRPDVGDFLVATSVLDRLTAPLCEAVTGRTDCQSLLEELERSNVLLVPLDEERRWYRYHHLFADLLRARLAAGDRTRPAVLHARAADWYDANGLRQEAIEHVLRSGDIDRARRLIADASADLIYSGRFATLIGWLDRLPDPVVRGDPVLSIMYAMALVLAGQAESVELRLADVEAALPPDAGSPPEAAMIPAYVALIRSLAARLNQDLEAAIALADVAISLAPPGGGRLIADARTTLGHLFLARGELDRAIDAYRAALPAERGVGNCAAVADITRNLARLEAREGHARAALELCESTLAEFRDSDGVERPAAAPIHVARAEILERLCDPRAAAIASRAMELARHGGDVVTLREARAVRDRVRGVTDGRPRPQPLVEPLTARELEVLRLVAAGRSNRQIAAELFLALGTVKTHVHAISGKLGAANRAEAAARAREIGLL